MSTCAGRRDIHVDEFLMMAAKREVCEDDEDELRQAFSVGFNASTVIIF